MSAAVPRPCDGEAAAAYAAARALTTNATERAFLDAQRAGRTGSTRTGNI